MEERVLVGLRKRKVEVRPIKVDERERKKTSKRKGEALGSFFFKKKMVFCFGLGRLWSFKKMQEVFFDALWLWWAGTIVCASVYIECAVRMLHLLVQFVFEPREHGRVQRGVRDGGARGFEEARELVRVPEAKKLEAVPY